MRGAPISGSRGQRGGEVFHRLREWSLEPPWATISRMISKTSTASAPAPRHPDSHSPPRRTRYGRHGLGVSLVALAVVSLGSTSAAQASSPRCAAGELRVVSSGSQGAAGTQFSALRFEHRGPGHCTLSGYPGVTLLNGPHRFNTDVGRFSTGRPRTVRVDARHRAYFDLVHRAMTSDGRTCRARVTHLWIIPPNTRRALRVRLRPKPLSLCLDSVRVQAVRSTSTLRSRAASSAPVRRHSASVRDCGSGGSVYRGQVRITNITNRNVVLRSGPPLRSRLRDQERLRDQLQLLRGRPLHLARLDMSQRRSPTQRHRPSLRDRQPRGALAIQVHVRRRRDRHSPLSGSTKAPERWR